MLRFFSSRKSAAVFVDFEHWCYSLSALYGLKPQIKAFYDEISEKYDIKRIYFFGDFTEPRLRSFVDEIRLVTNNIIDTQNPSSHIKKDFTDFILLDYIYRDIDEFPKTDTYIIFSGDGHFSSVASYLKIRKGRRVIIYGVAEATSNKLINIADECIEYPTDEQQKVAYYKMILDNLYSISQRSKETYPTFVATVSSVSEKNGAEDEKVAQALRELINEEIVTQKLIRTARGKKFKVLFTDWKLAAKSGYWNPPSERRR